jgi:trehalose 6-phosphate phosphatase
VRALPHALERESEIAARLAGRPFALFLDFDGTLAPIASRPEAARLPEPTREVLRRLAARAPVAILSGRARADVAARVGLTGIAYAGSHGFDLSGPDGDPLSLPPAAGAGDHLAGLIDRASTDLTRLLAGQAGVRLEPKGTALAVHYRQADPAQLPAIEAAVDTVTAAHPQLRKTAGKKLFELRPKLDWDKGRALLHLLAMFNPEAVPIYLGDDETDEDAFLAVSNLGTGILVAPEARPTAAQFRLNDPDEVRAFLLMLETLLGRPTQ